MNKKGFTLVELLAVITILGVILMVATPNVSKILRKSRINACEADKKAIEDLIRADITKRINENRDVITGTNKKIVDDLEINLPSELLEYKGDTATISKTTTNGISEYTITINKTCP